MKKTIYCKNINYSRAGKYFSKRLYETAAQAGISLMLILVLILGISIESSAANPKLNNQQVYVNSNPLSPSEMELPPPYDPIYSPECGIYFSYQFWNEWPPLPANIWNRPFWDLGNGIYLLDDIDFNYVELSSQTSPLSSSPSSLLSVTDNVYENIYHPYLTNVTASLSAPYTTTLQFTATGGMENVNYGIFSSTNGLNWNLEEYTQTGESHTYTNISQNQKLYALAHPEIITWGNAYSQNTELPTGIINAVELSCGMDNGLALLGDGSLEAWGNSAWDLNTVPDGLTNVSMITSGWQYHVALKQDGTVTSWGITNIPWMSLNPCAVPEGLTNVIQVSALALHTLALKTDGTVIGWGDAEYGKTTIPTGLTNVIAVSAGIQHSLALKTDGTVVAWGSNEEGQCDVPEGLTNVISIAAGAYHSLALKSDGTVVAWGLNSSKECDVPADLTNVIDIAAGGYKKGYSLALKNDRTVVAWGDKEVSEFASSLNHIVSIIGGSTRAMALRTGPTELMITVEPRDHYAKENSGTNYVFSVLAAGSQDISYQWQFNGIDLTGETNVSLTLSNPSQSQDGKYRAKVTNGKQTIYSREAQMGIVTPPVILSQSPTSSLDLQLGQMGLLSVEATADYEDIFPLSYHWKTYYPERNTNYNIANVNNYYFISYIQNRESSYYFCIVSNIIGSATSSVWQVNYSTNTNSIYLYPGTLAYHLATNTAAYASNKTLSSNGTLLDNFIPDTVNTSNSLSQLKWSTNCWLHGVKGLTATSVGTTGKQSGQGLMTLVSPIHYLRARHTSSTLTNFSNWVAFLDKNNTIHWRIPVEQIATDGFHDTIVGILNEPLPEDVEYLPVLPPDYSYLPIGQGIFQGIGMNQDMQAFSLPITMTIRNMNSSTVGWDPESAPELGLPLSWNIQLKDGDSSAPVRLLINDQLVLASHNISKLGGVNYQCLYNLINQYMKTLSEKHGRPIYQLTTIPLSEDFEKINNLIE